MRLEEVLTISCHRLFQNGIYLCTHGMYGGVFAYVLTPEILWKPTH